MSHAPRRALPDDDAKASQGPSQRRRLWIIALAALLVLGLAFAAAQIWRHHDNSTSTDNSSSDTGNDSASPSASNSPATCDATSQLAVDPSWVGPLTSVAATYAQSHTVQGSSGCAPIGVQGAQDADVAAHGLGKAKGWVPEDASVAAATRSVAPSGATVVGSTPLVLVAQQQVSEALNNRPLDNQTLYRLASSQTDWQGLTGKDWGPLRLVLPDPAHTAGGAIGFGDIAAVVAGKGTPAATPQAIRSNMIDVSQVQFHVAQTVATPADVLQNLAPVASDDTGRGAAGPRIGVTTQAALLNSHPAAKTLVAWPLLNGAAGEQLAIANPANDQQVSDFTTWLKGTDGRKALAAAGITTPDTTPDAAQLQNVGLPASMPVPVRAVSPSIVARSQAVYQRLGMRMAITNVLDASGSMGQMVPGTRIRKIDLVTQAAASTWKKWPDGGAVALLTFNSNAAGTPQITPVVPFSVAGTKEADAQLQQRASHLGEIKAEGGTPLYQAIWQGYTYALQHYDASKNNQVFIITDGADQDAKENITLQQLIAKLKATDASKHISMRYIGVGPEADNATLASIARQTGGQAASATSVAQLPQVVSALIASN